MSSTNFFSLEKEMQKLKDEMVRMKEENKQPDFDEKFLAKLLIIKEAILKHSSNPDFKIRISKHSKSFFIQIPLFIEGKPEVFAIQIARNSELEEAMADKNIFKGLFSLLNPQSRKRFKYNLELSFYDYSSVIFIKNNEAYFTQDYIHKSVIYNQDFDLFKHVKIKRVCKFDLQKHDIFYMLLNIIQILPTTEFTTELLSFIEEMKKELNYGFDSHNKSN